MAFSYMYLPLQLATPLVRSLDGSNKNSSRPRLKTLQTKLQNLQPLVPAPWSIGWRAGKSSAASRGYGHAWRKARDAFLYAHPLCRACETGMPARVTAATVVDHIVPHRGNQELFWHEANWQPLCARHHNAKTWAETLADREGE